MFFLVLDKRRLATLAVATWRIAIPRHLRIILLDQVGPCVNSSFRRVECGFQQLRRVCAAHPSLLRTGAICWDRNNL